MIYMKKKEANTTDAIKIMVVDDEESIREGATRILRRMGFEVIMASRGDEALRMLGKEKVSIIFLDLKMPGIDGMEVFRQVREIDESILVVIITGFATVETAIEALKGGAYDFIPKPFEPDHLRIVAGRAKEKLRLAYLEEERRKTLLDLGTEKSRVRTVMESLPNGLLVTNAKGQVALMNPAFQQQLCLESECGSGKFIRDYVKDKAFCDFVMDISQGKHMNPDETPTCELAIPNDKYFLARGRPVISEDNECLGAVINLADITAIRVLDQLKSEFVAKVSHELRSPLSTIHEQLAVVMHDMVEEASDKGQHILSRAQEKTRGLISLIGDLLDLSRIESGAMGQEARPVGLDELLKGITEFLDARAKAKKQSLWLRLPDIPLPQIMADPVSLDSIFGNLISNAINYTQEGGEIQVSIEQLAEEDGVGQGLRVKVADNGFGIAPKYHDKIFDRFYRVKTDKTRFITGTGLGLPIVKSLVDSMGGTITLDSDADRGTAFTVFFPLGSEK